MVLNASHLRTKLWKPGVFGDVIGEVLFRAVFPHLGMGQNIADDCITTYEYHTITMLLPYHCHIIAISFGAINIHSPVLIGDHPDGAFDAI